MPARAIEYVREHGPTATAPLTEAIDADQNSFSSCVLPCIREGLLVVEKRGHLRYWRVGDGVPLPIEDDDDEEPRPPSKPRPPVAAVAGMNGIDIDKATPRAQPFACGLFSDGRLVLELAAGAITLDRENTETLIKFLDRLAARAE